MVNVGKKVFKRKIEQIKNKRKRGRGSSIATGGDPNNEPLGKRQSWREEIQDDGPLTEAEASAVADNDSDESLTEMAKADLPMSLDDDENGVEGTSKKGIPTVPDVDKQSAEVAPNKNSVLSNVTFESLRGKVSDRTLDSVAAMGFVHMTEIQQKTIEPLLEGADVLGSAKTGSGKTLAFLIPAVELLVRSGWRQRDGTGVLIISPTRELSMQTYTVLSELMEKHPNLTHGLVMGGANRDTEARRLATGVGVLVATPGRLLDHLKNTDGFSVRQLKCFVIDEADRIFDVGFEEELHQIVRLLPKRRQTLLFSATYSNKVDDLVRVALHADPLKIGVAEPTDSSANGQQLATVEGLEQGYVVCPSERRFQLLYTFLRKNKTKKIMVFFSSCAAVQFYNELLNYVDVPVQGIHGKQKQQKRTCTFFSFSKAQDGVLLCTDVAARGLDIPAVDWIVQFDPPDDPREYIHRVGRTARGADGTGHALLILRPEELGFLRFLKSARVTLNEYEFAWTKLVEIQPQLEKLIAQNYYLNKSAKEAYKGYIRSYDSHSLKQIYDVNTLDLIQVAKSFGFKAPPFVDLPVANKPKVKPLPAGLVGSNARKRSAGVGGGCKTFVKPKMAKRK